MSTRTSYFISRHQGAKDWAKQNNIDVDNVQSHLDINTVQAGDIVIGTLPINLVAELCQRGASYYHLTLSLSKQLRGKELTAADMQNAGATIEQFIAHKVI